MIIIALQLLLNGLAAGAGYAMFAISFALVYRTTRFLHFAQAGIFVLGAYSVLGLSSRLGVGSLPLAAALGCSMTALLGAIAVWALTRGSRSGNTPPAVLLVASLGLLVVIQNLVAVAYGPGSQTLPWLLDQTLELGGAYITVVQCLIIASAVLTSGGVYIWMYRTRFGRTLRAVCDDPFLAGVKGLRSERVVFITVTVASAMAGLAGILMGLDTRLQPEMGFQPLLVGVVAVVIGGTRNIVGAAAGGVLIGILQQVEAWFFPAKWQDAIVFALLVLFLTVRPEGLTQAHFKS